MSEKNVGGEKQPLRTKSWADNITTGDEEKRAVLRVMESGYLSLFEGSHSPEAPFSFYGGPEVQTLEKMWCDAYGSSYAVAVNSATSGLYAAMGALGIGYGDEVIVSPYTMSACALAPLIYGAIPVFADVELETGCLDPVSVEARITPRTKAIIVIHQFGIPANMDAIMSLARTHNLSVVEDCAQAHGAYYRTKPVGTIGDVGVFSLNVNKTIQSGEGGVCLTNNEEIRYRLALIRNHGEAVVEAAGYKNITNIAGFNYRLTEIQAAIAQEQLKKLPLLNERRLMLAAYLTDALSSFYFLSIVRGRQECLSTYYLYPVRYVSQKTQFSRERFVALLKAEGVPWSIGYVKPLYYQPLYQTRTLFKNGYPFNAPPNKESSPDYSQGSCPNAEHLYFKEMIINEYVRYPHTKADMDDIIGAIRKVEQYA